MIGRLGESMVEVRCIDGQLKMRLYFRDGVPVVDANGYWRGPLKPSTGARQQIDHSILPAFLCL